MSKKQRIRPEFGERVHHETTSDYTGDFEQERCQALEQPGTSMSCRSVRRAQAPSCSSSRRWTEAAKGTIRYVWKARTRRACRCPFKVPTAEELDHDFLWRIHKHVPGAA